MTFKVKQKKQLGTRVYSFTPKEIEIDNKIFEVSDKGTRIEKIRLIKILKNRTKLLQSQVKY